MPCCSLALVALLAVPPSGGEQRALWTAIDDVRRTEAMYEAILAVPALEKARPFPATLRQKRRHERRLVKLAIRRGYGDAPVLWNRAEIEVPTDKRSACALAVTQELRNAAIYETALALPLSAAVLRVMRSIHRRVRGRHVPNFEACVRRS